MSARLRFCAIGLILAYGQACSALDPSNPPLEWFECEQPSDCVAAQTACCENPAFVIRGDAFFEYERLTCLRPCDIGCICICVPLQGLAASCVDHRCVAIAPTREEVSCTSDDECVEVAARCGECPAEFNYCNVAPRVVVSRAGAESFEDRVCGDLDFCDPIPGELAPRFYDETPTCISGRCLPAYFADR